MPDGPLRGQRIAVPSAGEASACARDLLECLGADVTAAGDDLGLAAADDVADWAASGAMALTGQADGPPRLIDAAPASLLRAALAILGRRASRVSLPGVQLLGERAAAAGLHRRAPWSAGGAFRAVRAQDGWFGMSLARDSDVELLPALVGADVSDPWIDVERWVRTQPVDVVEQRAILLGLPAAGVPVGTAAPRAPVRTHRGGRRTARPPVVVDLTSLWAGPLCAHLLGLAGVRVIKVESADRLDGARRGPAAFYDLLHAGHESVVLDFASDAGRAALQSLVGAADLVLEASRPRALAQLGLDAERAVARGTSWVSITAYGRAEPDAMRVGFGDDVAAAAGLVCWDGETPIPAGDAIADPLAGAVAAAAASAALSGPDAWLVDVSMREVAALAARVPTGADRAEVRQSPAGWELLLDERRLPVAEPAIRPAPLPAAPPGAHTTAVLAELAR